MDDATARDQGTTGKETRAFGAEENVVHAYNAAKTEQLRDAARRRLRAAAAPAGSTASAGGRTVTVSGSAASRLLASTFGDSAGAADVAVTVPDPIPAHQILNPPPVAPNMQRRTHTAALLPLYTISGVPQFDATLVQSPYNTVSWAALMREI
jgi:hypothetical protein